MGGGRSDRTVVSTRELCALGGEAVLWMFSFQTGTTLFPGDKPKHLLAEPLGAEEVNEKVDGVCAVQAQKANLLKEGPLGDLVRRHVRGVEGVVDEDVHTPR